MIVIVKFESTVTIVESGVAFEYCVSNVESETVASSLVVKLELTVVKSRSIFCSFEIEFESCVTIVESEAAASSTLVKFESTVTIVESGVAFESCVSNVESETVASFMVVRFSSFVSVITDFVAVVSAEYIKFDVKNFVFDSVMLVVDFVVVVVVVDMIVVCIITQIKLTVVYFLDEGHGSSLKN